nr:hypothetical protein [Tanacetum cinerariifolium]
MERGFLNSGDKKKKKEGISSTPSDEFLVLSGIAKNVKNIEGKTNVPKSILKKAVFNIVNDIHEVKMYNVPVLAYSEDGLSLLATQIGGTQPSVSIYNNDNGVPNPGLTTANPFDVLNGNGDDMGKSETQPKAGFTSVSTSVGGRNQIEDEDSDFYDGYEDQVVDLHGALKEYRDFMLSMSVLPKSKLVSVTAVRPISDAVPKIMKSRPNYAHTIDTKSKSTTRKHKTRGHFSKTSNSSSRVTAAKAQ